MVNYFENGSIKVRYNGPLQAKNFENWYYPMPEEGISIFEIQTPLENFTPPHQSGREWGGGEIGAIID